MPVTSSPETDVGHVPLREMLETVRCEAYHLETWAEINAKHGRAPEPHKADKARTFRAIQRLLEQIEDNQDACQRFFATLPKPRRRWEDIDDGE